MFSRQHKVWSFHVLVLQRTQRNFKIYNACAQPLFYSLDLLFSDVPIAVAIMFFLNFLIKC